MGGKGVTQLNTLTSRGSPTARAVRTTAVRGMTTQLLDRTPNGVQYESVNINLTYHQQGNPLRNRTMYVARCFSDRSSRPSARDLNRTDRTIIGREGTERAMTHHALPCCPCRPSCLLPLLPLCSLLPLQVGGCAQKRHHTHRQQAMLYLRRCTTGRTTG